MAKADSLHGLPAHAFGEPLRQFPGLEKLPTQATEGMVLYDYPRESKAATDWFGKHRAELGYVFYYFQDNQFVGLRVSTLGPEPTRRVLEEATFLFGPGTRQADAGYAWPGKQVLVTTHPTYNFNGQGQQLDIFLVAALDKQTQRKAARLKAENASR